MAHERKFGWLKQKRDKRDLTVKDMVARSGKVKAPVNYLQQILDQDGTSSCVGFAVLNAFLIERAKQDKDFVLFSALFNYWWSRWYTSDQKKDEGTYIRNALKAFNRFGLCRESKWRFRKRKVNKKPNLKAIMDAYAWRDYMEFYRIPRRGREAQVKQGVLSRGNTIIFGSRISKEFVHTDGKMPLKPPKISEEIGGHAQCIVDCTDKKSGNDEYLILNQWGNDFGYRGFSLYSAEYIRSNKCSNFTEVRLAE